MDLKDDRLAYWQAAIEEEITLREILPALSEKWQKYLQNENNFTLDMRILFEKMITGELYKTEEEKRWLAENSLDFRFLFEESKSEPTEWKLLFQKRYFRLSSEQLLVRYIEDREYRKKILKQTGTSPKILFKQPFLTKKMDNLTEYELQRFDELTAQAEDDSTLKWNEWPDLIDEIAKAYTAECVRRAELKTNTQGLTMKPLNIT